MAERAKNRTLSRTIRRDKPCSPIKWAFIDEHWYNSPGDGFTHQFDDTDGERPLHELYGFGALGGLGGSGGLGGLGGSGGLSGLGGSGSLGRSMAFAGLSAGAAPCRRPPRPPGRITATCGSGPVPVGPSSVDCVEAPDAPAGKSTIRAVKINRLAFIDTSFLGWPWLAGCSRPV